MMNSLQVGCNILDIWQMMIYKKNNITVSVNFNRKLPDEPKGAYHLSEQAGRTAQFLNIIPLFARTDRPDW